MDSTAQLFFAISNGLAKPPMTARLTLKLPSGWSMDGEGFANKCSGLCTANHEIATGDQQYVEVAAYPNHTGTFLLEGRVEFVYDGEQESNFVARDVPITVRPGVGGNTRVQPLPTSPQQLTATSQPTSPPQPTATPPPATATPPPATATRAAPASATRAAPASAGGNGGQQPGGGPGNGAGCGAPPPDVPGVIDPSLLLAGLLIPAGILARLGINRSSRSRRQLWGWTG